MRSLFSGTYLSFVIDSNLSDFFHSSVLFAFDFSIQIPIQKEEEKTNLHLCF